VTDNVHLIAYLVVTTVVIAYAKVLEWLL